MTTPPAAGIDLGKRQLFIAIADAPRAEAFTTHILELKDPTWRDHLRAAIPPGSTVLLEPTGTHYAAPVLAALPDTIIYHATHDLAGHFRRAFLSRSKTDALDARALALAARMIQRGEDVRGAKHYDPTLAQPTQALRMMVNNYLRATRDRTRALNRLDALLHGIAPELVAFKETYAALVHLRQEPDPAHAQMQDRPPHITPKAWAAQNRSLRQMEQRWREPAAPILAALLMLADDLEEANIRQDRALNAIRSALSMPPFVDVAALWSTAPYITAQACAAFLVACGGDPRRVTRDQFTRACGVAPSRWQSGATDRTSKEARPGYRPAMLYLHLMMMQLIGSPRANPIKNYRAKGKSGGACKRKLAAILWGIANSGEPCNW